MSKEHFIMTAAWRRFKLLLALHPSVSSGLSLAEGVHFNSCILTLSLLFSATAFVLLFEKDAETEMS